MDQKGLRNQVHSLAESMNIYSASCICKMLGWDLRLISNAGVTTLMSVVRDYLLSFEKSHFHGFLNFGVLLLV